MKSVFKGLIVVAAVALTGCATICPILNVVADTAKDACPIVVEYLDSDGKKQQVQIPREFVMGAVENAALKSGKPLPKGALSASASASVHAVVGSASAKK